MVNSKALVIAWLATLSMPAQEFRALISGVLRDPSGAAVAGASIRATNLATNVHATVTSAGDGNYVLPQLPAGRYELTAEAPGFRKYSRAGIVLNIGDKAVIDIDLEIGALGESVTVTAELTGIESNQSVLGQVMDTKKVSELPLNGRHFAMLLQLSAGVLYTQQVFGPTGWSGTRPWETGPGAGLFSIHGSRTGTNAFLLDGAPQGIEGGVSYTPLVDAIEEFKVVAPPQDASQGLTGGGVVSVTMKSGTNDLHGLLSHFIRNNIFDAVATQTNRAAAQRPDLKRQQHQWNSFAAMVTGPIVKNKFFFSGNYDGFRQRVPFPLTVTMPTAAQRTGDFSQTLNSAGQLVTIYDPLTTRQAGSSFVRDPFAENRIPAGRIVPVATNILQLVPQANIVTNPITNFNNFAASPNVGKYGYNSYYVKFDYNWNERHRTFASETQNYGFEYRSGNGLPTGNPAKNGNDPLRREHWGATLDHVYTITTTTVFNGRIAWDRWLQYSRQDSIDEFDGSKLGFKGRIGSFPVTRFPALTFTDYASLGTGGRAFAPNEVYSAVADVSKTVNRHFLKLGTRFGQGRYSRNASGNWYGSFDFTKPFTQRDPQRADASSGHAIASFLLGYPSGGGTDVNPQSTFENKFLGLYIQDDFKLSAKLTLNLGLRWDVQTPPTERFDRLVIGFDPNVTYALGAARARGGFVFGDTSRRRPWETNWRDFQPRLGIAWQLGKKLVWRAGYGLSFLPINGSGGAGTIQQNGYSRRTPVVATIGGGLDSYVPGRPGTGTFENPFPEGILQPFGAGLGPRTQVGQGITYLDRGYDVPRVHQFHIGFNYELPWMMTAEVSYVGSRTRKFSVSQSANAIALEERLKGVADPNYLNASVANPFAGAPELAGTGLAAATITRAQSLRPFPQFTGVTMSGLSMGSTSYNALETRLNKRLSSGLSVTGAYTFAKVLEAVSFREEQYTFLERRLIDFDRTHHLTAFALYEVPVGHGRKFGSHMRPVLDRLLGNWQYNFAIEHQNGTPTAMPDATPVRDPRLPDKSFNRWFATCTLLTSGQRANCASADEAVTWVQLKPNELRTYSTRFPNLRNHWRPNINMSLFKSVPVRERMALELRAEAFNAFNSPIYGGPNTGLTSSQFGVVTLDQQNFPRSMQFALRLKF